MADSKTTYVFDGETGNIGKCSVTGITAAAAAGVFKTFLASHSDGAINSMSYSERTIDDAAPAAGSNTDRRGIAYFQDLSSGGVVPVTIPAIKSTNVVDVPGRQGGERLTDTFLGLLKAALETATGGTYRILYGVVVEKR